MPEQTKTAGWGLLSSEQVPVPLAGVSIAADIRSLCARVTVAQRYVNRESMAIEAVYVFPLDENAAVCGFEAVIDGTLVIGEVKEREEAFQQYDDAITGGHGAFLLDEERPDVFQASVGNLPPGKEVLLKITYVTEVTISDGALRFVIPTTVSPRYAPAQDWSAVGRPDAEALNPPHAWSVPYGLDLSVRVQVPGRTARVESPSHPISMSVDEDGMTITLAQQDAALDRDFVLSVEGAGLETPRAWLERTEDGQHAIAVGFVPQLAAEPAPAEIIFVVDRSGSMAGSSIDEVRNALQLCLRSMIPGCAFNIVGFGSRFESLFPESRAYDERSLADANAGVASIEADLGGTEILPALEFALTRERRRGLARQIVVLTDGEVTNTDAVIALVKAHAADARVFAFGIGAGASRHLVRGLARAGGGTAEFIAPRERIESKVLRVFRNLLSPAVTDVQIDWDRLDVVAAPAVLPPIFSGSRMIAYGFVRKPRSATLRLTATAPGGPVAFEVPLDCATAGQGAVVATLAARARIRELEESPEWLHARGSRQSRARVNPTSQEIIDLAVRYGLVSRETSFVAIERREAPLVGDMQLRRVPIAVTSGWGGIDRAAGAMTSLAWPSMAAPLDTSAPRIMARRAAGPFGWFRGGLKRSVPGLDGAVESTLESRSPDASRAAVWLPASASARATDRRASDDENRFMALVTLQHADGGWDLTSELAAIVGVDSDDLLNALPIGQRPHDAEDGRRAWGTALALAWLRRHAADREDEWHLLAGKAGRWLAQLGIVPEQGSWVDAADRWLSGAGRQ